MAGRSLVIFSHQGHVVGRMDALPEGKRLKERGIRGLASYIEEVRGRCDVVRLQIGLLVQEGDDEVASVSPIPPEKVIPFLTEHLG